MIMICITKGGKWSIKYAVIEKIPVTYKNAFLLNLKVTDLGKTHIKSDFFIGWTTKGVGRVNPPDH